MEKSKFNLLFESIQNEFEKMYDFDLDKAKVSQVHDESDISDVHNTILKIYSYSPKTDNFTEAETIIENFKYTEPDKDDLEDIEEFSFDVNDKTVTFDEADKNDNIFVRIEVKDKNSDKIFFDRITNRKNKNLVLNAINGLRKW
jgi:hypothetical protein